MHNSEEDRRAGMGGRKENNSFSLVTFSPLQSPVLAGPSWQSYLSKIQPENDKVGISQSGMELRRKPLFFISNFSADERER